MFCRCRGAGRCLSRAEWRRLANEDPVERKKCLREALRTFTSKRQHTDPSSSAVSRRLRGYDGSRVSPSAVLDSPRLLPRPPQLTLARSLSVSRACELPHSSHRSGFLAAALYLSRSFSVYTRAQAASPPIFVCANLNSSSLSTTPPLRHSFSPCPSPPPSTDVPTRLAPLRATADLTELSRREVGARTLSYASASTWNRTTPISLPEVRATDHLVLFLPAR